MEKLGINFTFLLSQIVNFLILFGALRFLLWKPMLRMLEARKQRIAKGLEDAEEAERTRARAEEEYQRRLEEGRQEAERLRAEAVAEAEREKAELLAQARAEAERILAGAQEEVERQRQQMLTELRAQVAVLSVAVANKLIGEVLDERRQQRLIDEFFSGIQAGRVVVLDEAELARSGGKVTASVTSALPLTEEEQATIARNLTSHLGEEAKLEFTVDPAILGGLVVRVGDRVIDGSVAGKLSALQRSLV